MSEKYTNEKYVVTWDMFHMHARKLAERLLPASQWKGIIAVSRGGLFPAAVLARELSIRHVETVCIASYDHDSQGELKVLHAAQVANGGEGFIVVSSCPGSTARGSPALRSPCRPAGCRATSRHWPRRPPASRSG